MERMSVLHVRKIMKELSTPLLPGVKWLHQAEVGRGWG